MSPLAWAGAALCAIEQTPYSVRGKSVPAAVAWSREIMKLVRCSRCAKYSWPIDAPDDLHPLILILGHPALVIELVRGVVSGLQDESFALLDDDARNALLRSLLLLGLRIRRLIGLL